MPMKVQVPPIKSQGIKTKLVPWIAKCVPDDFNGRWIEPFMGTGVVGFNVGVEQAIMCDTNPHLIAFYKGIQSGDINSLICRDFLTREGRELEEKGQEHYYYIRSRFNDEANPLDFLFLNRACFNGMIRFNRKGGFNVPFCRKDNRFSPAYITKISNQVEAISKIIQSAQFEFRCCSFEESIGLAGSDDLIYCDPPYIGRHVDYFNSWDESAELALYNSLDRTEARFILSTWHHNDFRSNKFIQSHWNKFQVLTKEHFYHVGGRESNRNPMIEALITNYDPIEFSRGGDVQLDPIQSELILLDA